MPELPEVETIKRQLNKELKQKKFKTVEIRLPKMVRGSSSAYKKKIIGSRITKVNRRGKFLVIEISNNYSIIVHLKMTGQLIIRNGTRVKSGGHPIPDGDKNLPNKYTHVIWHFTDGSLLYFNDLRQFGFTQVIQSSDCSNYFKYLKLGQEPLDKDFTFNLFMDLFSRKKKMKVKQALLDQTLIVGLGNIYAAEVCFDARVNPTRPVNSLSKKELLSIYQAVKKILKNAVVAQGSTVDNYTDAYGNAGLYVPKLKVYGRADKRCFRCKAIIKTIKLGGRGTAYCPKCQK